MNGILINGSDIRVAVQNTLGYTFGRIVGLGQNTIGGQARVASNGDALPIAVRHYINAPGPTTGAVYPCDGDTNDFQDLVSTAETACLGSVTSTSLRTMPTPGMNYDPLNKNNDPAHHGPIIQLVGQGAQSSNTSGFRGFVALDIRNFYDVSSNVFYNGVTAGANANTIAALEAGWVAKGYPGPDFPPVVVPPDPNDQIGILDGNKSGIIISAIDNRFTEGDEVLAAVYSGTVMSIPDFALTVPTTIPIDTTQNRDGQVSMSATKNSAFTGLVYTSAFKDWSTDPNPYGSTLAPLTFTPYPATPATTITWATFNTTAAPAGIYTIWIKGHSPSPVLIDHFYPVAINVGGVKRDFSSSGAGQVVAARHDRRNRDRFDHDHHPEHRQHRFSNTGATVTLSLEGGPQDNGVLPVGLGATSLTPSSFSLSKGQSQTINISINGGSLGPGEYPLTIRATGTNADGQPVTRLIPITLDIATASTSSQYVDIMGFAIFRITDINSNSVDGYAISGVYADMNDPALRRGQVARLVPWN